METISPTARALSTLEALQDSPGVSAERLALRLGVTERAVRRYVRLLRDAGIQIESTTGRYGGYRLGRGSRPPPLMLTSAEALGLAMAVVQGDSGAADPAHPVGSAIGKIVRVLPRSLAEAVAAIRHVTAAQTGAMPEQPDPETLVALVRAAEAQRRVRFTYRLREGLVMEVDPWAVSVWRGRWYLLCWSHASDARRVLRVDRIAAPAVLEKGFTAPEGLDAAATIDEHMSTGWGYDVEVVIDAPVEQVARWIRRSVGRLEPTADGRTRLLGTTESPFWYARHLTALEAPYRIVAPQELRDAARDMGARLAGAASAD
ncbi:MAG TPA: WYL domain-containing protein [Mycobacteriales bacterium]|nr:WYL domain-containing protein [Mycobacteriales bacterium]